MIYFRLCFSFSCSGYDLTLIKKSHTLNSYLFFLLLVNVVAQFTAKTTKSEKAISFLSLKSHLLFTGKSFTKILCFPINVEKKYLLQQMEGGWHPPTLYLRPWYYKIEEAMYLLDYFSEETSLWARSEYSQKWSIQVYIGSCGKSHRIMINSSISRGKSRRVMINSSISRGKSHSLNVCGGK